MTAIRRPGFASAAVAGGLALSFLTVHLLAPEWSREAGLDVWNLPSLEAQLRLASQEQQEILAHEERAARRREAAQHIALQLINGRDLGAAADDLAEVFRNDPGVQVVISTQYDNAPTLRHRFARHAMDRVKFFLRDNPAQSRAVLERLEAEYEHLDCSPKMD